MFKKIAKGFGLLILSVLIIGAALGAHEWYAKKPFFFRVFLDRAMVKVAFDSPETLTSLGFLESLGIKGHNAHLDDARPEKTDELIAYMKQVKQGLLAYKDDELNENQKLSKEIALYLLNYAEQADRFRYHGYPVNQLFGIQNGYPSFMESSHQITDEEDAKNYLSRLQEVKRKFSQELDGLKIREQKGIIPPRFVIDRVLDEMNNFVNQPVEENILYVSLKDKMAKTDIPANKQQALLTQAKQNIEQYVHPAYHSFIDYFTALAPKAGNDDGFWHLPDGDAAYESSLKFFTTTNYSAEQIHQMGLSEVDRIQAEMLKILGDLGYDTTQGFTAAIDALAADPQYYYEDSKQGREQILKDYQAILDEINAGLDNAFNLRPKAGLEVVRIPEFKEKTAPGAYYNQPSLDGTRKGRFYANLYDIKATPKYGMRTLAYHEGIPGHHFQIAIAMELEGLPFFRKMSPFTAYTEGWALYAEHLAWELGFEKNPVDNIGRLQAELFRAVRLVVDTGIHKKHWTRQQAIDYMRANTGMALSDVTAEIERYIVMPGQATAYKVGMMKILELREKAKTALGSQFNLKDFHDVVLKNGAVPLDILERLVEQYIQQKQSA